MRGALVVFEGAEGVGKSTQLARLVARARTVGIATAVVREPGGTPLGDEIRRLVLDAPHAVTPRAEALLFMASRAQLVEDVVRPALAAGKLVFADRFFLSTYAYQVAGRGLPDRDVEQANRFATDALTPQLTLLLDLPIGHGLARAVKRSFADRVERSGKDFHEKVALAFRDFATAEWQRAHPECGPIVRVDASGTEEEVEERLWQALAPVVETFTEAQGSNKR